MKRLSGWVHLLGLPAALALLACGGVDRQSSTGDADGVGGAGAGVGGAGSGASGASSPAGNGGACSGECCAQVPGAIDGRWFVTLSAKINAKKPLVFIGDVATTAASGGTTLSVTLQPLAAEDRETPVGSAIAATPAPVQPQGDFVLAIPNALVPGAANPISGSDIAGDFTLSGVLCDDRAFVCGDLGGQITQPLMLDLTGSTFTFQRLENSEVYPVPLLDCAGNEADPL